MKAALSAILFVVLVSGIEAKSANDAPVRSTFDEPKPEDVPAWSTFDEPKPEDVPAWSTFDEPKPEDVPAWSTFDEPKPEDIPSMSTLDEPKHEEGRSDRHRRVTCDLLSFNTKWGSFNHSVCAAHCLALFRGYRGGHCDDNGVCICRK